jgi:hypothetical protein
LEVVLGSKIAVNYPGSGWYKGVVANPDSKRSRFIVTWTEFDDPKFTGNKNVLLYLYLCKNDPHKLTCLGGGLGGEKGGAESSSFQPYEARLLFNPTACLGAVPPEQKDSRLTAAFFRAVMEDNFDALKDLVCQGADPAAKNGAGLTPGEVAIRMKKMAAIRLLLLSGILPLDKRMLMSGHVLSNGEVSNGLEKEGIDSLIAANALPAAWSMQ